MKFLGPFFEIILLIFSNARARRTGTVFLTTRRNKKFLNTGTVLRDALDRYGTVRYYVIFDGAAERNKYGTGTSGRFMVVMAF